jgi:hypothetical protein
MEDVKAPFVINAFYKAGNDTIDYRFDRSYHEKTSDTPELKKFKFENIVCNNVSYGLGYFLGLPEAKIEEIVLDNIFVRYDLNAKAGVMAMTLENEEYNKIGIYASNVCKLKLNNIHYDNEPSIKLIRNNVDEVEIC